MFHKQNARQPWAAALLGLLLALTSAFSCIGLSGWASFRRQIAGLDAQYTTVAYAVNGSQMPFGYSYYYLSQEDGYTILDDGTVISPEGETWIPDSQVVGGAGAGGAWPGDQCAHCRPHPGPQGDELRRRGPHGLCGHL